MGNLEVRQGIADDRLSRRRVIQGGGAALAALGLLGVAGFGIAQPTAAQTNEPAVAPSPSGKPTIVLAHGAWADGSGWAAVIGLLQASGYTVVAPPIGLGSLSADIAAVRKFVTDLQAPTLLVGHSYGGAVISGAASGLASVKGLVFLASFSLDTGESLLSLTEQFTAQYGPTPNGQYLRPDGPLTDPHTQIYLDRAHYGEVFVQDIDRNVAAVLAATQRPLGVGAFAEPLQVAPAWRSIRSWYQVSAQDRSLQPQGERWLARRMGAEILELNTSHAAMFSQPGAIAKLILKAARAVA